MQNPHSQELRKLPQIDRLARSIPGPAPRTLKARAARAAVEEAARSIVTGSAAPTFEQLIETATERLDHAGATGTTALINATGVLLHTNLGRAPLPPEALAAVADRSFGYSDLEFDLGSMSRGSRYDAASAGLCALTGAEAALVVNNNAAAVLLALAAMAAGKQVIISRGELIEIGGEFRIPDIMSASGAELKEVGTTNRTHLKDYERALGERTGAILKVHPSNYRVVGFSASVDATALSKLASQNGLPFIYDIGSGLLQRRVGGVDIAWLSQEPTVREALDSGADIVTFSGDKLFGGPQCGIILGKAEAIAKLKTSPLLRAFRIDKMTIAALEAVLDMYLDGRESELPFFQMALTDIVTLEERARLICEGLEHANAKLEVVDGFSTTGGGSAPGSEIPTLLIEITSRDRSAESLRKALGAHSPPVIARVDDDKLIIDIRTVFEHQDAALRSALASLL